MFKDSVWKGLISVLTHRGRVCVSFIQPFSRTFTSLSYIDFGGFLFLHVFFLRIYLCSKFSETTRKDWVKVYRPYGQFSFFQIFIQNC